MLAVRVSSGTTFPPFDDAVGQTRILTSTLAEAQEAALSAAGFTLVASAPTDAPYLVISDRVWFTASFLRCVRATGGVGRVRISDETWLREMGPLQTAPERPEVAMVAAGAPPSLDGPDLPVDLQLRAAPPVVLHPAFAHAQRPLVTGTRLVHGVEHWSHVLRVNLLALVATAEEAKAEFEASPFWKRALRVIGILLRARSVKPHAIARALNRVGRGCTIHPTAVVEACQLGNNVEVGPYALLRGCIVGDGAKIEDYAHASVSVIGAGARLGRTAMCNFSVLYPGAFVSAGGGWQMCVFGRDAFVAMTATAYDLSFGGPIRVVHQGAVVSAETHFLGVAVGHRAKIGAHVKMGYGMAVPNDAFLVAPSGDVLRKWPDAIEGAATVRDGVAVPVVAPKPAP
jgi:carbonic anhydrase/acetyltransferase-like protein (isoleucine patch superfamily)